MNDVCHGKGERHDEIRQEGPRDWSSQGGPSQPNDIAHQERSDAGEHLRDQALRQGALAQAELGRGWPAAMQPGRLARGTGNGSMISPPVCAPGLMRSCGSNGARSSGRSSQRSRSTTRGPPSSIDCPPRSESNRPSAPTPRPKVPLGATRWRVVYCVQTAVGVLRPSCTGRPKWTSTQDSAGLGRLVRGPCCVPLRRSSCRLAWAGDRASVVCRLPLRDLSLEQGWSVA